MATVNLPKGEGKGTYKLAFGTADLASGGAIDTGFDNINSWDADIGNDITSGTASVTGSVSAGTLFVFHNSQGGTSVTVNYQIIGY